MTKLSRLKLLVRSILGNNLAGMIAAWIFVFPVPIIIWLGFAYLEELGILPEPLATCLVCGLPAWICVALAYIFIRIRKHFKNK